MEPRFAGVSIKLEGPGFRPSLPGPGTPSPVQPGGKYVDPQSELGELIAFAYPEHTQRRTILGYPGWAGPHGAFGFFAFDAEAAPGTSPSLDEMRLMMRAVLADRFKLRFHVENRAMPVYYLVVGKGGPRHLKIFDPRREQYSPQRFWFVGKYGAIVGRGITMVELAGGLGDGFTAPLIDHTGLAGRYDIYLEPKPASATPAGTWPDAQATQAMFIKTLRDQLGLDVISGEGLVPVMVIDHVELPTAN